ncbi:MAG: hypothetical protein WBJ06_00510 [Candidatus Methanoculleus thermohydrogenotrophicum]|jgi:hypothetical protein
MMRFPANRLFCLALLLMVILVAACGTPVTRSLSTAEPGAGEIFIVSLSIEGITLGGVVETLPDGYTFAGTEHPDDRVLVRGQKIAFAVMNDTSITYSVKAPASGSGDITGEWEDFIAESHGQVAASHVAVDGIEAPGVGNPSTTEVQAGSPYTALIAVAGLLLVAYRGDRR